MPIIDADTHVDETEETWKYLDEASRGITPVTVIHQTSVPGQRPAGDDRYWLIDGALRLRRVRDDKRTGTVVETRELLDVPARLRHMDELGVDIHIMYPTLFITAVSERSDVELALCRAYNRWIAAKCEGTNGRLRWIAVLPTLSMDQTLEEMRFAKENGAVGVYKKGVECGHRGAGDSYFFPLYQAANDLDLAICMHIGMGDPSFNQITRGFAVRWAGALSVVDACTSLVTAGVPQRFPRLRVGFIEAGAAWVPYVLSSLQAVKDRLAGRQSFTLSPDLFRDCRFYVAYQTQEDLPYLLQHGLEDSLVVGSDYSHPDQASELQALRVMRDRAEHRQVDPTVVRKMLDDNPRALYGL